MSVDHAPLALRLRRLRRQECVAAIIDVVIVALIAAFGASAGANLVGINSTIPASIAAALAAALRWRSPRSLAEIAARLDEQNGLSDLLGSAWAVRDRLDQPWAAGLWVMANGHVDTLPPPSWPGRFSARQQACGVAMAAAALLMTRLINPSTAVAADDHRPLSVTAAVAQPANQSIADIHQRPGDFAESPARLPAEQEAAGPDRSAGSDRRIALPGDATNGPGGSDAKRPTALPAATPVSGNLPTESGASGSGRSDLSRPDSAAESSGGLIAATRAEDTQNATGGPLSPTPPSDRRSRPSAAASTPPAYRDLVREFFAR
ncbi:MAG: hypothetical protein JWM57_1797 [Phycisphaerales bacterium]|nr:hypothetical protein [Phycisphaerales bacterium]